MTPGMPSKPTNLSERAAKEWDRIVGELTDSNIIVAKAHRALIAQAATIAADIADAWETVQTEGPYFENQKTGALQMHPAARRLDSLRRDYIKVLSLIGLRTPVQREGKGTESLEDLLNG